MIRYEHQSVWHVQQEFVLGFATIVTFQLLALIYFNDSLDTLVASQNDVRRRKQLIHPEQEGAKVSRSPLDMSAINPWRKYGQG